jgi:hypothetical protein
MKSVLAAMLVLGPLAVGCTGQPGPQPSPPFASPAPTVTVRFSKPQNVIVQQRGDYGFVVKPVSARMLGHQIIREGGAAVCPIETPAFHYVLSDVSNAGLTMAITCIADGSHHQVRVVFVPEST